MSRAAKILLSIVLVYYVFVVGVAVASVVAIFSGGVISVQVHERNGAHVHVPVPAALVNIPAKIVSFIPRSLTICESEEIARWRPVIRAAVEELEHYPDIMLVEVEDGDEGVRIAKRNGSLVIEVESWDADVVVNVPPSTVRAVLEPLRRL